MGKRIRAEKVTAKSRRFVIAVILAVLAGWAFNASGQTETNLYSFFGAPTDG
jgi:hypothetical protein